MRHTILSVLNLLREVVQKLIEEGPWPLTEGWEGDSPWARSTRHEERLHKAALVFSETLKTEEELKTAYFLVHVVCEGVHPHSGRRMNGGFAEAPSWTNVLFVHRYSERGKAILSALKEGLEQAAHIRGLPYPFPEENTGLEVARELLNARALAEAREVLACLLASTWGMIVAYKERDYFKELRGKKDELEGLWKTLTALEGANNS